MSYPRTRVNVTLWDQPMEIQTVYPNGDDLFRSYSAAPDGVRNGSEISDIAAKRRRKRGPSRLKRYAPTPVDHTRVRLVGFSSPKGGAPPTSESITKVALSDWGSAFSLSDVKAHIYHSTEAEISDFAQTAFAELSAQMPEVISIPNFIFELGDVSSLLNIKSLLNVKHSRIEYLQNFALWQEFGIKPFVSDIQTLLNLSSTVMERIKFLKRTYGKRVRVGTYAAIERSLPDVMEKQFGAVINHNTPGVRWVATPLTRQSQFRAGAYVTHFLENLDDLDSLLRAFAVATGFSNPLLVAWNAIPYSFMIDWITNVSGLLEQASARPFMGRWIVEDFTWSVKDLVEYRLHADVPHGLSRPGSFLPMELGRLVAERYRRGCALPARAIGLELPPSPREALLLLALLR